MAEKKPLIIISGATGVGKSLLSVLLAGNINGEIISADSMQVYRGFDIGTAKITKEEMGSIPHHLIDILDPDEEFNIFEFKTRALKAIDEITSRGAVPIICGGTGFYIQSVIYDIDFEDESPDKDYRTYLEDMAMDKGAGYMHAMLARIDPESAASIHPNNVKRVIRALEFAHENGIPISRHNAEQKERSSPFNFAYFVLERPRAEVYERINRRVDQMISDGLESEIRGLLESGVSKDCLAMQGIGYKEMIPYIDGQITLDEAVYQIKLNTRHFAKRQDTWFRREKDIIRISYNDHGDIDPMVSYMADILKDKNII